MLDAAAASQGTAQGQLVSPPAPFAVQPDIQWVIHPNTDPPIRNAPVFGFRGEVSLSIQ
jgi:hypothetical protein